VGPVPDPLVLRKSGSAGNRTRTSVSVARNSDHWTTEAARNDYRMHKYNESLKKYGSTEGRKEVKILKVVQYTVIIYSDFAEIWQQSYHIINRNIN
jgi:hypothetical protein